MQHAGNWGEDTWFEIRVTVGGRVEGGVDMGLLIQYPGGAFCNLILTEPCKVEGSTSFDKEIVP